VAAVVVVSVSPLEFQLSGGMGMGPVGPSGPVGEPTHRPAASITGVEPMETELG
jgi:hypothetical protein